MKASRKKVEFSNENGVKLAGILEMPAESPQAFALFAHCFTCSKDVPAAARISRHLAAQGIAVLRFDFAGIGASEGDFGDTTFSTNIDDLKAAAAFLRENYQAPSLIIGHSLGGAAVLAASGEVPECKCVVTVGAPASPNHVRHHFSAHEDRIREQGKAEVELVGRKFNIGAEFLEDIEQFDLAQRVAKLAGNGKALLVFHSPLDDTVGIAEAAEIYQAAKHPKSFVSLDKADHLLTSADDAQYVAATITAWAARYLPGVGAQKDKKLTSNNGTVVVTEKNRAYTREVVTGGHSWLADEPVDAGGANMGPNPYDMLLASLGSCTSMTVRMYANLKELPLDTIKVTLSHERNGDDEKIIREIELAGELSDEQKQRMLEIANRCPVAKSIGAGIQIESLLV